MNEDDYPEDLLKMYEEYLLKMYDQDYPEDLL